MAASIRWLAGFHHASLPGLLLAPVSGWFDFSNAGTWPIWAGNNPFGAIFTFVLGAVTGVLASLLGWQINLLALHRGLERGRTSAFFIGFGSLAGDCLFSFIAFAGAAPLVDKLHLWIYFRWIGIATIFLVGLKILLHKQEGGISQKKKNKREPAKHFLVGFLTVISNPAILIVWIGIIAFLLAHFPSNAILAYRWFFMIGLLSGGAGWFLFLALYVLPHVRQWGDERLHLISKISAGILILGGFFLAFGNF